MNKIESILTKDLKPYERNNKKHTKKQVEKIADSIKEFGFVNPILIDAENVIIAGHGRLQGLDYLRAQVGDTFKRKDGLEIDLTKVPTIKVDHLSDVQVKALRIADNRLGELTEIDWESLKIEFDELKLEGLDELTGFTDNDFKFLDSKEENKDINSSKSKKKLSHVAKCPNCDHEFKLKQED